ncbi:MAG: hypothetical protein REI78_12325 [Pedobacter sp.]|nr:hypothetical protein [Pedobacter sp.]MDQ8053810.1 hypothetical protein [Pedobacter sp.]
MNRFLCIVAMMLSIGLSSSAQDGNTYEDFKMYRNTAEDKPEAIGKMKVLLADSAHLKPKQVTNISYHIGRLFEELELPDSAEIYYVKALAGEPNYEVIHRALGFIYLERTKVVTAEMGAIADRDTEKRARVYAKYKSLVLKALPHFEKYQACDPDEDTLAIIMSLHKSIKTGETDASVAERLKKLAVNCVTLLDDE